MPSLSFGEKNEYKTMMFLSLGGRTTNASSILCFFRNSCHKWNKLLSLSLSERAESVMACASETSLWTRETGLSVREIQLHLKCSLFNIASNILLQFKEKARGWQTCRLLKGCLYSFMRLYWSLGLDCFPDRFCFCSCKFVELVLS
jgi:hypothetical protein